MSYVDKIQIGSTEYDVQDTKTRQMIAGVYSTSGTYAVGDYVTYDGKLYRCVTAIDTAEAWTVAHWTEVTVGGDVADLKSAISNTETRVENELQHGVIYIYTDLTKWYNGYVNASGEFVSANSTITPANAPVKLNKGDTVICSTGTFVCGVGIYEYDSGNDTYTRKSSEDKTGTVQITSNSDNYYYALVFKTNPQAAVLPSAFDGSISVYADWMEQIVASSKKLDPDGMIKCFTDLSEWTQGYFSASGAVTSSSWKITPITEPILLYKGDSIIIDPAGLVCTISLYNYNSNVYVRQSSSTITTKTTLSYNANQYLAFDFGKDPGAKTEPSEFVGSILASVTWKQDIYQNSSRITVLENAAATGNYLAGKKLVACGDSITAAVNPLGGNFDSYAKLVAIRNGMVFDVNAVSGSTMTNVAGKSPFCVDRYEEVPSDFDYLTIWFGFNDGAYAEVGTISDTTDTTFYGAYKKVLEYFLTEYPTKKIGLIVPYMSDDDFQQAVRDVSELYGVPCLDLPNYNKCSLVWGSANTAQTARTNALTYDGTHPNQTGHNFISTMYEQFLLSL